MLLTISTTHQPAADLGYLLHKHPDRCQAFDLAFGKAHMFYPEAAPEPCTAALLLDVDPIGLVRTRRGPAGEGSLLQQYVNDRPYVASSLMSVAISRVFGSAMAGTCGDRPELVDQALPLAARLSVLPCRGGESVFRRLFEPLGCDVQATRHSLDGMFADWDDSGAVVATFALLRATAVVAAPDAESLRQTVEVMGQQINGILKGEADFGVDDVTFTRVLADPA